MAISDMIDRAKAWAMPNSYRGKYSVLPQPVTSGQAEGVRVRPHGWRDSHERNRSMLRLTMAGLLFAAILYLLAGYMRSPGAGSCDSVGDGFHCRPDISHFWGQYSPWYPVTSSISRAAPSGCKVTFAQVLSRHGARDPTSTKSAIYSALMERIHDQVTEYGKDFAFIESYNYTLGADELSRFGQQELVNSGEHFYKRYAHLAKDVSPFVRSAGQHRVVQSAQNWTQGFHQARLDDERSSSPDSYPYHMVILPETSNFNNTLSHQNCPAFERGPISEIGDHAKATWVDVFAPPITERLNENLRGADLSDWDTIQFMDLCPFETVANDYGKLSRFCSLFSNDEWHSYDYYQSLDKWYGFSNGNPLAPTQGVGFVNELIARLTGNAVDDNTNTNSTLDHSPETFPLGRALYADFSHDNDMAAIYAALGLFNATEPLSNTTKASPQDTNGYSASWTVPFAARMYVEKMSCEESDEEMVRVLVNDRVMPLQNCGVDKFGRCTLSRFVDSLSFARGGGHWDVCYD